MWLAVSSYLLDFRLSFAYDLNKRCDCDYHEPNADT